MQDQPEYCYETTNTTGLITCSASTLCVTGIPFFQSAFFSGCIGIRVAGKTGSARENVLQLWEAGDHFLVKAFARAIQAAIDKSAREVGLVVAFLATELVAVSDDDQAIACARESDVDSVRFGEEAELLSGDSVNKTDIRFFALKTIECFHAEGLEIVLLPELALKLDDCTAIEIELRRVGREDGDISGSEGGIIQQISHHFHDQDNVTLVEL